MACIFCAIVEGSAPASVVYEDEYTLAFLDISPATPGHTLVVPRAHADDLLAASDEVASRLGTAVRNVASLLDRRLEPGGINVVQANRAAAWQTVFHLHFHVIPRYEDDGLVPPWRPSAPAEGALDQLHQRLTALP